MGAGDFATIDVEHRVIDGWHVFTSKDVEGLYVAHPEMATAFDAVAPTIEKLLELNENLRVIVRPSEPLARMLVRLRQPSAVPKIDFEQRQFVVIREAA